VEVQGTGADAPHAGGTHRLVPTGIWISCTYKGGHCCLGYIRRSCWHQLRDCFTPPIELAIHAQHLCDWPCVVHAALTAPKHHLHHLTCCCLLLQAARSVVLRMVHSTISRGWECWRAHTRHSLQKQAAGAIAERNLLRYAYKTWHSAAVQHRHAVTRSEQLMVRVLGRMQHQLLSGALAGWRQRAHITRGAAALLRRLLSTTRTGCFRAWKQQAAAQVFMRGAQQNLLSFFTSQAQSRPAELSRQAVGKLVMGPLAAAAFNTWKENAADAAHSRVLASKALWHMTGNLAGKAVAAWKGAMRVAHNKRVSAAAYQASLLQKAWGGWAGFLRYRKQVGRAHQVVVMHQVLVYKPELTMLPTLRPALHEDQH
jgi:hypothetical protein